MKKKRSATKDSIYRITFVSEESIYEVYVGSIYESELFGFIEVEEFIFGENTSLVVDPSEEQLKLEFSGVKRSYIPMHAVLRIDVVEKQGSGTVKGLKNGAKTNVSKFPDLSKFDTRHKRGDD